MWLNSTHGLLSTDVELALAGDVATHSLAMVPARAFEILGEELGQLGKLGLPQTLPQVLEKRVHALSMR